MSSVAFPAVTFCPENLPLMILSCTTERSGLLTSNCPPQTITTTYVVVEGINQTCYTFNSQGTIMSQGEHDELAIELYINNTNWMNYEPVIGALCFVHDPNTPPMLEQESTFVVSGGKITSVFLSVNVIHYLNGTIERDWVATHSSASVDLNANPAAQTIFDTDFVIINPGVFNVTQYYAYTVHQWIGEVGGFACLLIFLHRTVVFLIMFIVHRRYPPVEHL
jgi:hypothetical protein